MAGLTLSEAELVLEVEMGFWRTDVLHNLSGNLVNIAPYQVPPGEGREAYAFLWRELTQLDATELIKFLARAELKNRKYRVSDSSTCPSCGKGNAIVVEYDGGSYFRIVHPGEVSGDFTQGKAPKLARHCYFGPNPPASRFEGSS